MLSSNIPAAPWKDKPGDLMRSTLSRTSMTLKISISVAAKTANDLDLPYLRKHWTRLSANEYELAVSVFRAWCDARGVKDAPEKLSIDMLADLLPRFVMEARRQDETPYPPATLMQIVAGIQRHFRENGQPSLSVFGDKDPRFARTRGALDARMKKLTKEGVGTETMQAQPLTPEQEEKLWCLGDFGERDV